jgi:hypothetical protein
MDTVVIIRAPKPNDEHSVRFTSQNAPPLLAGDTFGLPLMGNLGIVTVKKRHWHGQALHLICEGNKFLVNHLIQDGKKIPCRVDDYELPEQDWTFPSDEE